MYGAGTNDARVIVNLANDLPHAARVHLTVTLRTWRDPLEPLESWTIRTEAPENASVDALVVPWDAVTGAQLVPLHTVLLPPYDCITPTPTALCPKPTACFLLLRSSPASQLRALDVPSMVLPLGTLSSNELPPVQLSVTSVQVDGADASCMVRSDMVGHVMAGV